jgi:hypothetical protein
MAHTIYCGKIAKRKNSTLQPTTAQLATSFDVLLKSPTSLHTPTFTISAASFDFNYIKWGDRYYFVTDVASRNNNLWEVSAVCDVLATFKADITASTQFVCYSSHNSNTWLPDTRIPLVKATKTSRSTASASDIFNTTGFYVLSVNGQDGCVMYALDKGQLDTLLTNINTWQNDIITNITGDAMGLGYDFTTIENALESVGKMSIQTGVIGNAYAQAPQCIRSCIWVPFFASPFVTTGAQMYLGNFDTGLHPFTVKAEPVVVNKSVSIPWHYNDWRRGICEDVYLYLPLAGMMKLSGDSLTNVSSLSIKCSATASDGVIAYEVSAGGNVIGTYGGQCSANYPIGINQQASAGEILQSIIGGGEKMVNAAINSSISPVSMAAAGAGVALEGVAAAYDTVNIANTTHATVIGGVGGGAGSGLSLDIQCYTVCHETVMTPSDMKDTMGLPTMLPYPLATLTGYCQCANAHVAANGAESQELDTIDMYLNSGFYIE